MKQSSKLIAFFVPVTVGTVLLATFFLVLDFADLFYQLRFPLEIRVAGGIAYGCFGLFLVAFYFLKRQYEEMAWAFLGTLIGAGLAFLVWAFTLASVICSPGFGGC